MSIRYRTLGGTGIIGGEANEVLLVTDSGAEHWEKMDKREVAAQLAARIGEEFA